MQEDKEIPEKARVLSKVDDWQSGIPVYKLCLGNGLHAEYDDLAADVYCHDKSLSPSENVKITPCDCATTYSQDVPEIVKERLRQLGNESTR